MKLQFNSIVVFSIITFQSFSTFCAILDKRLENGQQNILQVLDFTDLEENALNSSEEETIKQLSFVPINGTNTAEKNYQCNLNPSLIEEIRSYKIVANKIFSTILNGTFKSRTYDELAYFVDRFGSRIAGSKNLENAIDYMLDKMQQDDLENVHGEDVKIPHWVR